MATNGNTEFPQFYCETCNIISSNKKDFKNHILTLKHQKRGNRQQITVLTDQVKTNNECSKCSKTYESRSGLWRHKKKCNIVKENGIIETTSTNIEEVSQTDIDLKILILEVIKNNSELQKQNSELQKQMIEVCKNSNNTTINSNNKTFNLNFFLNEQCKDAMNISEFVNTFDLQLEDLESVGELGYVEGMTKIIVDKLNSMDIYKRPMHCSDAKREIIYIKDENIWAREERTNPKLRQAIKNVTFRNMKQVKKWSDKHPESLNNESHLNDKYMMLVIQSTGGNGLIGDSENKIIRRIVKEIVIGKNTL